MYPDKFIHIAPVGIVTLRLV